MMQDMTSTLTKDQFDAFLNLASALSPENLHCDGEITQAQAARKYKALKKQWSALEKEVGRTVTEDELWSSYASRRR
jgi:hypothetical protein